MDGLPAPLVEMVEVEPPATTPAVSSNNSPPARHRMNLPPPKYSGGHKHSRTPSDFSYMGGPHKRKQGPHPSAVPGPSKRMRTRSGSGEESAAAASGHAKPVSDLFPLSYHSARHFLQTGGTDDAAKDAKGAPPESGRRVRFQDPPRSPRTYPTARYRRGGARPTRGHALRRPPVPYHPHHGPPPQTQLSYADCRRIISLKNHQISAMRRKVAEVKREQQRIQDRLAKEETEMAQMEEELAAEWNRKVHELRQQQRAPTSCSKADAEPVHDDEVGKRFLRKLLEEARRVCGSRADPLHEESEEDMSDVHFALSMFDVPKSPLSGASPFLPTPSAGPGAAGEDELDLDDLPFLDYARDDDQMTEYDWYDPYQDGLYGSSDSDSDDGKMEEGDASDTSEPPHTPAWAVTPRRASPPGDPPHPPHPPVAAMMWSDDELA